MTKSLFCLMGPSGCGKTALAIELVQRFPFEIISVDSAMIYRDMNIGTAKPSAADCAIAPHHLIDCVNPDQSFSVAQFCTEVAALTPAIFAKGKVPLLVGGTMMYFHALHHGLAKLPAADPVLRQALLTEDLSSLHQTLAALDPESAKRIHPADRQRLYRALEIVTQTNQPMAALIREQTPCLPYPLVTLQIMPPDRALLHQQIATRFQTMLAQGFVQEVEHLLKKWNLDLDCPALRCVGYRQAVAYLNQAISYQAFIDQAVAATRQLVKRQLTWLRNWKTEATVFDSPEAVGKVIHQFLDRE